MNVKYYGKFESWSKEFSQVQLVCDGSSSNEERLGAVACIQVAIQQFQIQDDLIVIGGYVRMCIQGGWVCRVGSVHVVMLY